MTFQQSLILHACVLQVWYEPDIIMIMGNKMKWNKVFKWEAIAPKDGMAYILYLIIVLLQHVKIYHCGFISFSGSVLDNLHEEFQIIIELNIKI